MDRELFEKAVLKTNTINGIDNAIKEFEKRFVSDGSVKVYISHELKMEICKSVVLRLNAEKARLEKEFDEL